ncbi:MAG: hypothetical protein IIA59_00670 [Candidatus Marinimicrobia bacterium]|nr:hypothetical protein [Candidatus Neomarinimicrobiota bacterium]
MGRPHWAAVPFEIDGQQVLVRYDWQALRTLKDKFGENYEGAFGVAYMNLDLEVMAGYLAVGLELEQDGQWTAEAIIAASPPVLETFDAVRKALNLINSGKEDPEQDENPQTGLVRKLLSMIGLNGRSADAPPVASPQTDSGD